MIATTIKRFRARFTRSVDIAEHTQCNCFARIGELHVSDCPLASDANLISIEDIRATEPWLPVRYTLTVNGRIVKYDVSEDDLFGVMATNTNVDLHTLMNVRSTLKTTPLATVALGNVLVRPFELEDLL